MNTTVCGVPRGTTRVIKDGEEEVVNDFGREWDELHLLRIGIQGARGRKERAAYLKIKDGVFSHVP